MQMSALESMSFRNKAEFGRLLVEIAESRGMTAAMSMVVLNSVFQLSEMERNALKLIGESITDEMIETVEKHMENGGAEPGYEAITIICGLHDPEAQQKMLEQYLKSPMSHTDMIAEVMTKMPKTALQDMAPKWSDPAHIRAAAIEHCKTMLAALENADASSMTSEEVMKESNDMTLICMAMSGLIPTSLRRQIRVKRLKKFEETAELPPLATSEKKAKPEKSMNAITLDALFGSAGMLKSGMN